MRVHKASTRGGSPKKTTSRARQNGPFLHHEGIVPRPSTLHHLSSCAMDCGKRAVARRPVRRRRAPARAARPRWPASSRVAGSACAGTSLIDSVRSWRRVVCAAVLQKRDTIDRIDTTDHVRRATDRFRSRRGSRDLHFITPPSHHAWHTVHFITPSHHVVATVALIRAIAFAHALARVPIVCARSRPPRPPPRPPPR